MVILLAFLLLLFYGASNIHCSTVNHENIPDMLSLLDFKAATSDPTDALRSWDRRVHYCNWTGVICSSFNPGRVAALQLAGKRLSGEITPSLGNLTFLKVLNLSSNGFSGQLTPLNKLHQLVILDLGSNSFQGIIPDLLTNCSNLKLLNLSSNGFSGQLPPLNLNQLHELVSLDLSSNSFHGIIPDSLTNCSNLKVLNLSSNGFAGQLPPLNLNQLHELVRLDLSSNSFQGIIPDSVTNCSNLKLLDLSSNGFSGQLPPLNLNQLRELVRLDLSSNSFHGIIPDSLTNCSNLKLMNLSRNMLEGPIPTKIGSLYNLIAIDLCKNNLTGVIPPSIGNATQLEILGLHENQLRGNIPGELGQLSKIGSLYNLIAIDLSRNNLTGVIPPSIGNATQLEVLGLQENQLRGNIPGELGQLSKMLYLSVGENRLSGQIPQSIFNLTSLQRLGLYVNKLQGELPHDIGDTLPEIILFSMGKNMLEGHIPASLGNASGLQMIDLSYNSFVGEIPTFGKLPNLERLSLGYNMLESSESQRWESLYGLTNCSNLYAITLANNQLQGAIPDLVGRLSSKLRRLHMNGNNLSGIVPLSLANLSSIIDLNLSNNSLTGTIEGWLESLRNLQLLDIHGNNFVGPIPPSFGNLSGLTIFSLAKNEFQGPIPPILGKLSQLSRLDLSYNNLQGDIPPEISELTQLIALSLSSNRLSGKIPDNLGQCQGLLTIQMDHNNLTGVIPTSLGNLLSLDMLNLSHNDLSGVIPTVLSDLQLLSKLDLSYNRLGGEIPRNGLFEHPANVSLDGNLGLCGQATGFHVPSCRDASPKTGRHYRLITVLTPLIGFMSLALLTCFIIHKKTPKAAFSLLPSLREKFPRVSYWDIARVTRDFSEINLIGKGSYSSVYRGNLSQVKTEVAIKVLDLEIRGAEGSFALECKALRGIRHRNIVPLITECSAIDNKGNAFRALIYAFMSNGNLDTWLHHQGNQAAGSHLILAQRISIATNMADALDYLHHDSGRPIIHCDLKPSNILLDIHMNACLGDFGIARFYVDSKLRTVGDSSSVTANGTLGYMAPEYAESGHASTCGDVYSFGIVLLEMLTGKRPTDDMFRNELTIVRFVEMNFPDRTLNFLDSRLVNECNNAVDQVAAGTENPPIFQSLLPLLRVALLCTRRSPTERLNMREVATQMRKINMVNTGELGAQLLLGDLSAGLPKGAKEEKEVQLESADKMIASKNVM